jgi:hypothetical protein
VLVGGIAIASLAFACAEFAGEGGADAADDGKPPSDAPSDAGLDVASNDAATATGCQAPHLFCDDFDDDAAFPPGRWSTFMAFDGSTRRVEGGIGGTLAGSFTNATTSEFVFYGPRVTFPIAGPLAGLRCELDVATSAPTAPPDKQPVFLAFLRATLPSSSATTFWLGGVRHDAPTSFTLTEEYVVADAGADGGEGHFVSQAAVSPTNFRRDGTWTHVSFELNGATGLDTLTVGTLARTGPSHFPTTVESIVLELGNEPLMPDQVFAFQFDNVVCDRP